MSDRREAAGVVGGGTRNARGTEKNDAAGGLLGEAVEKPVDHEPAKAMADEVHLRGRELPYEIGEARRDAAHSGKDRGVTEGVQRESELVRQARLEDQRLLPRHSHSMYVDECCHGDTFSAV